MVQWYQKKNKMKYFYQNTFILTIILISVLCLSSGCKQQEDLEDYQEPTLTHSLEKVGEYEIDIDSMTTSNVTHYQYYSDGGKEYFSMLNVVTQEINFYDINLKELAFKIPLRYEGPNSVGNLQGFNSGYFIHNLDSIFALNRNSGALYLVNSNSERVFTYSFRRERPSSPMAILPQYAPMIVDNNQAILLNFQAGIKFGEKNRKHISEYATKIDLTNQGLTYGISYPEPYTKGKWPMGMYKISWQIDNKAKRIAVSYPLDHALHVFDYDFNPVASHIVPSKLKVQNRSISKNEMSSEPKEKRYYWGQSKYGQLFFDPYNKVYMRECLEALSDAGLDGLDKGIFPKFNRSLILTDENFQKIGEVIEPFKENLIMFFTKTGIHRLVQTQNEDKLKFEVYELSKL